MTASDPCLDWQFDSPSEITAAGLEELQRQRAQLAFEEAEYILRLAELCPADDDPAPEHPGAKKRGWSPHEERPGVSEFFLDQLAMVLNVGRGTAAFRARRAFCWHPREGGPSTAPLRAACCRGGPPDGAVSSEAVATRSPERMATVMALDYLILGVALGVGVIGLTRGDNRAALFVVIAAVVLVLSARFRRLRRGI